MIDRHSSSEKHVLQSVADRILWGIVIKSDNTYECWIADHAYCIHYCI